MPLPKLESLSLAAFRGATKPLTVSFDPGHRITMIFGENGCGKSTLVDAFGFVAKRDLGSISDHSGSDSSYVTAIGCKSAETSVSLKTSNGAWTARLGSKKSVSVTPEAGCPPLEILRRKQILDLVDAQPKARFDELGKYINVQGVSQSEQGLRDAVRQVENDLNWEIGLKTAAEEHLQTFWEAEGKGGVSAFSWAKAEAAKDQAQLSQTISLANSIDGLPATTTQKKEDWDAYLGRCQSAKEKLSEANEALQKIATATATQSPELLKVLQDTKAFLARHTDTASCPVCSAPVNAATLASDIDHRIGAMDTLATAATAVADAKRRHEALETQRDAEFDKIAKAISKAIDTITKTDFATLGLDSSEKAPWQHLQTLEKLEDRISRLPDAISQFAPSLSKIITARDNAQRILNQHNAIKGHVAQIESSTAKVENLDRLHKRLSALLATVESERKTFVAEVLTTISSEVETLYAKVHPGESVGGVKLTIDPNRIGSLHLHADFHSEKGITPQSVFSESHLDTLGLCVFLVLAKRYGTENSIIILDDVLTSVDAVHLDRVIALLHEEATHFIHTIITTHYRPWRDRYRFHRAPAGNIAFMELRAWSLETGIRLSKSDSSLADLKAALAASAFDRQAVASKAGQLLENLLDFLARRYQCKLPLTGQPHYTLGELLDCFSKKLRPALRVERLDGTKTPDTAGTAEWVRMPIAPVLDKLKPLSLVRNQVGAHYNTLGSDCTDQEVETFANAVVELAELLICPAGGDLPDRSKTGSWHHSRSGHVRLFPLEEPA